MTVLRPGDLVILKSGGPVMTVDTVNTDIFDDDKVTGVLCAWFVGDKLERARFDCNAIAPAPPQEVSSDQVEPQPPEAAGEFKAVIDDMMAAMNDAAEASGAPLVGPKQTSRQKSARKKDAGTAAPNGMN